MSRFAKNDQNVSVKFQCANNDYFITFIRLLKYYTHNSFDVWSFFIEDKILRNIGKIIIKCERALIEIIGISIHFSSFKKMLLFFNCSYEAKMRLNVMKLCSKVKLR